MRTTRPLLPLMVLLAASACFRPEETRRATSARAPPDAGAPASVVRAGGGPTPASEPLPEAAPPRRQDAGALASGCRVDDDCAVTRMDPGACCLGCAARAVTRLELEAINAHVADCRDRGFKCAFPLCAPERRILRPACEGGVCVLHAESGD